MQIVLQRFCNILLWDFGIWPKRGGGGVNGILFTVHKALENYEWKSQEESVFLETTGLKGRNICFFIQNFNVLIWMNLEFKYDTEIN